MNHMNNIYFLAAYNCNAYGAGQYGECATTTTGNQNTSGGFLADTGYNILIPAALGLAIVIASAILLIKMLVRRKRHSN